MSAKFSHLVTAERLADGADELTLGTVKTTTSGTAHDFTNIPSWVNRITLTLSGVSTSGTGALLVQLGTGGVPETSGYLGAGGFSQNGAVAGAANYTTGFGDGTALAANVRHYSIVLTRHDGNKWSCSGHGGLSNAGTFMVMGGTKSLAGALDMVRLTTSNGTDTFDAGTANILYE